MLLAIVWLVRDRIKLLFLTVLSRSTEHLWCHHRLSSFYFLQYCPAQLNTCVVITDLAFFSKIFDLSGLFVRLCRISAYVHCGTSTRSVSSQLVTSKFFLQLSGNVHSSDGAFGWYRISRCCCWWAVCFRRSCTTDLAGRSSRIKQPGMIIVFFSCWNIIQTIVGSRYEVMSHWIYARQFSYVNLLCWNQQPQQHYNTNNNNTVYRLWQLKAGLTN